MKTLYLALVVVGVLVPYAAFVPWVMEHGFAPALFVEEMFSTRIAAFFSLDVLVSALVVMAAALHARAQGRKGLLPTVLGTCLVGVSAGLPLYLYYREESRRSPSSD